MVLIDRKKLEEQIKEAFKGNPGIMGMLLHWIRKQKAVDAVQVVRCGECKNYDVETAWCKIHSCFVDRNGQFCHPWESNEWKMFDGAYYCADGERKEDNGT